MEKDRGLEGWRVSRRRESEVRGQKTENRGQKTEGWKAGGLEG